MKRAVCTGSFDPVTVGHVDIFERASALVDELIVCIFVNRKKHYMFSLDDRIKFLSMSIEHLPNVKVDHFEGLVTEYMKIVNANVIVRGLRSTADFDHEFREAQMIKRLEPSLETIFLLTAPELLIINSSGVRELISFNASIQGLVPACVEEAIKISSGDDYVST